MAKNAVALLAAIVVLTLFFSSASLILPVSTETIDEWLARPCFYAQPAASAAVAGYSPSQMRAAYNLPSSGGEGTTIAIVIAYHCPTILADLTVFSNQFGLPLPTEANFEAHKMASVIAEDPGWAKEAALDVQWAHAIAPQAKILLVEAVSNARNNLVAAIDYARSRPDVVSISMSWGDDEAPSDAFYENRLTSAYGATFFAASGDWGAGTFWPAVSPNVVGVGGTKLTLSSDGSVISETGWSGSGGGISLYFSKPVYQTQYGIPGTKRQMPDVSYNADPATGVAVYYDSSWYKIGGTSAGAPQWAAIHAIGLSASNTNIYDKARTSINASYLRDVTLGSNGDFSCSAGYDLVTGLGSPLTVDFLTGPVLPDSNFITLIAAEQSTTLNFTNRFSVNYISEGNIRTEYASDGILSFNTDPGTSYTVSGTSSASTAQEKWVFNSDFSAVSGSNLTLRYYHVLAQQVGYVIQGGGTPQAPSAGFISAPLAASPQNAPRAVDLILSQMPQTLWTLRGTVLTVTNPLSTSADERWTTQLSFWLISEPDQIPQPIAYYHQFNISVSLTGESPSPPTFFYSINGTQSSFQLADTAKAIWVDSGTQYTVSSQYSDVHPGERWVPNPNTGTIFSEQILTFDLNHEVLLNITGLDVDSQWFEMGTSAQVTTPGVLNRSGGVGLRVISYSVDEAAPVQVTPTTGNVTISVLMETPHTVTMNFKRQFQITLDDAASSMLASITAPTLSGDDKWFDEETQVLVSLFGAGNRSEGVGTRVSYYTVNGVGASVSTLAQFPVFNGPIRAPQSISATITKQYLLTLPSGSVVGVFSTVPPVQNDGGWYDSGIVRVEYSYSWNSVSGSRLNAVSYSVNQGSPIPLVRSGERTFSVLVTMNAPQTISIFSVTQHSLTVTGGLNVVLSSSQTADSFYDLGTIVTASSRQIRREGEGIRQTLIAYTLDGQTSDVSATEIGTTTVSVAMSTARELIFKTITQFQVSFQLKDNNGSQIISPDFFQIRVTESLVEVQSPILWLKNGTQFQVAVVTWQNIDVEPAEKPVYAVDSPINVTVLCRIFNATLVLQNEYGEAVSGADVRVTLANQTTVERISGEDGMVKLAMIPQGKFNASVTYLSRTFDFSGDASSNQTTTFTVSTQTNVAPTQSPTPAPTVPEFATEAILSILLSSISLVAIAYRKRFLSKRVLSS